MGVDEMEPTTQVASAHSSGEKSIEAGHGTAEKTGYGDEKAPEFTEKPSTPTSDPSNDNGLPAYDIEGEVIHHPADTGDILTHTIHVDDDPTIPSLTFRTFFLGK